MDCRFRMTLRAWLLFALMSQVSGAWEVGGFIYQGQLKRDGRPVTALVDMEFQMFDAAESGQATSGAVQISDVPVVDGLFEVELDFGSSVFDGSTVWLDIRILVSPDVDFVALTPRQKITPVPYAMHALNGSVGGASLDDSYDSGGAGAGRTIQADAGRVEILGPDGLYSEGGVRSGDARMGPAASYFDIEARRNLDISTGDDAPPTTVGVSVANLDGPGVQDDWVALRARRGAGQIIHRGGGRLEFVRESSPDDSTGTTDVSIESDGHLHLHGVKDASITNGSGNMVIGRVDAKNVAFDDDEIMARNNGQRSALSINKEGGDVYFSETTVNGNVGIGTNAPATRLHIGGFTSASPSGGGAIQMGSSFGRNMVLDSNDIMVRDNGEPGVLFLNDNGGDVVIGGAIDIGYEIVTASASGIATVNCPAGKKAIGGGCGDQDGGDQVEGSYPLEGGIGWYCHVQGGEIAEVYAVCARVK